VADENWIEWQGGEMPVHPDDYVEVDYGDFYWDGRASSFDWSAKPEGIIAYRVVLQ
jgi:hypothetical protein